MRRLGISLYPERSTFDKDQAYLDLAKKHGFSRVFTSLLEVTGAQDEVLTNFRKVINYATSLDFKVIVDMNPRIFKHLDIKYDDLKFFADLGVTGLRLDEGFTGLEEAEMTRNPYGLKIEINMSAGTHYLDNIMAYQPNTENLIGCHNFYPQQYTGLDWDFFIKWSQLFKKYDLHTAAFVTSHTANFGPWPIQDGLPTLESDRDLPITTQTKHLLLSGLIDDVIIGNAYASEPELAQMQLVFNQLQPDLQVELTPQLSELEKEIVLQNIHLYRGDQSAYLLRDTKTRVKYKDQSIPAHLAEPIKRGDVIVVNDKYGQYKGEMQIALIPMQNDGRRNVVGHLTAADLNLLDLIRPWSSFTLSEK